MALKQITLRHQRKTLELALEEQRSKAATLDATKAELDTRSAELSTATDELTAETPQEQRDALSAAVTEFEQRSAAYDTERAAVTAEVARLEGEIQRVNDEIKEIDERTKVEAPTPAPAAQTTDTRSKEDTIMQTRKFFGLDLEQRNALVIRDDVKAFLTEVRSSLNTRAVGGAKLTVPDVLLGLIRENLGEYSKLYGAVNVRRLTGTGRMQIMGAMPEAVWTEATGGLNELDLSLNQITIDGYMVGGFIPIHNNFIEDSDLNLAAEILDALARAIGKALDRAILYGTGTKQPIGIVTRLAQTSEPADWGANAPAWTDLHTTNVVKLNIASATGEAFFVDLIEALAVAKSDYADPATLIHVMNRKTHMDIKAKALKFGGAAAYIAAGEGSMPVIGGRIIESELVGDYEIVSGYGNLYLLGEREGSRIEGNGNVRWLENTTVFKGYARYDGKPTIGEGFAIVSYDNSDAATTSTFEADYANTDIGTLVVTSAAGTSAGDTKLTVTGNAASGTTLAYKVAGAPLAVKPDTKPTGYTAWDGDDDLTIATGKTVTVVELDAKGKAIKAGSCVVTAKA